MKTLLGRLNFPNEVEAAVGRVLTDRDIPSVAERAYRGENFDYPLCHQPPLIRLAAVTYLLKTKFWEYREKGASEEITLDTFRDVSLRARLYWEKTGSAGLSEEDVIWFRHIMKAGIFKIGVLQYQPLEMLYLDEEGIGEPYMDFFERPLAAGAPVLNVHIQRGTDLSPAAVEASLAAARSFFGGDYQAFLCYSWLLYPPMVARLPKTSNIRRFAEQFVVIGCCGDSEQARENLDGRSGSLQKMAADSMDDFGFACGILLLDQK